MYLEFYGLKEEPFNLTPDSHFLYLSDQHRKALSHLKYGIEHKKGFIALTGEVGSGKTTVCRALLKMLDRQKHETALVLNSFVSSENLLRMIHKDFGIASEKPKEKETVPDDPGALKEFLIDGLNRFLLQQDREGKTVILIIDECQNLSFEVLEQIRMLSNLETEKEKLLQIILIGQPEFLEKLSSYELRQLNQRITVRSHLAPLKYEECRDYIMHRLKIAGSDGSIRFAENAMKMIFRHCNGIPRRINIICDYCLIVGYVEEVRTITQDIVKKALKEIQVKRSLTLRQKMGEDAAFKRSVWKKLFIAVSLFLALTFGWIYKEPVLSFWKESYHQFNERKNAAALEQANEQIEVVKVAEERPPSQQRGQGFTEITDVEPEEIVKDAKEKDHPDSKPERDEKAEEDKQPEGALPEEAAVPDEDIEMEVEGSVSIEDIPEGIPSAVIRKEDERPSVNAKKRKRPEKIVKDVESEKAFAGLNAREKALWLLLSAWGIDYNLTKSQSISGSQDMDRVIKRFNFVEVETWESLEYLLEVNLPFAVQTPQGEYFVVIHEKGDTFYARKSPSERGQVKKAFLLKNWKGKSLVLLEKGAYTLSKEKTYFRGEKNEEVVKLKRMLKAAGYYPGEEDDFYDIECEDAVKNFQRGFLDYADGTVGVETILMLYSRFAQNVPRLSE